eukprot:6807771-Karenia_brevis.AAC.1
MAVLEEVQTLMKFKMLKDQASFILEDANPLRRLDVARKWGFSKMLMLLGDFLKADTIWKTMDWRSYLAGSKLMVEASKNFEEVQNGVLKSMLVTFRQMLQVSSCQP